MPGGAPSGESIGPPSNARGDGDGKDKSNASNGNNKKTKEDKRKRKRNRKVVGGLTPTQILLKLGQINICDLGASENKWEFLRIMMLPTWEGGYGYDAIALQETRLVNGGDWKCKLEKHCPWGTLVAELV